MEAMGIEETKEQLRSLVKIGATMEQKYDVVVTNPPYMGLSNANGNLNDFVKKNYPDSKADLFAVFIERCGQMIKKNCYQAMITQHSWMFLSSFEKLRDKLLLFDTINMAHLGARAFEEIGGEVVQTTAFTFRKSHLNNYKATYVRLVDYSSQKAKEEAFHTKNNLCIAKQENFSKIPGIPVAYWVSEKVLKLFYTQKSVRDYAEPRHGMSTGNNVICLKLWYEVVVNKIAFNCSTLSEFEDSNQRFIPYRKGGEFRKWYGNNDYIIAYDQPSREYMQSLSGYRSSSIKYFFKPSINWSDVSTSNFGVRYSYVRLSENCHKCS